MLLFVGALLAVSLLSKSSAKAKVGSVEDPKDGKPFFRTTYSHIDRLFYVYLVTKNGTNEQEIGYQQQKPTLEDIAKMYYKHNGWIGKPTARLEFNNNEEMAKHFACPKPPKIYFSKN